MEDYIIIAILLVVIVAAVLRAKKHFKGGCCGSGSTVIRSRKTLTEPKIGEKTVTIAGMHCENCGIRVENALNRLEGVVCKVNLKKGTANVSYSAEAADAELKRAVEELGYKVTAIR